MSRRARVLLLLLGCTPEASIGREQLVERSRDVSGNYTVSALYGPNGCELSDWPEGDTLYNVDVRIEQDGGALVTTVGGIPGGVLGLVHGSNRYEGTLVGSDAELRITGTIPRTRDACLFTLDNELSLRLDGDTLQGALRFVSALPDRPACAGFECETSMTVSGTRAASP